MISRNSQSSRLVFLFADDFFAHIGNQDFRNFYGSIFLLIIFDKCDEDSWCCDSSIVHGVAIFHFTLAITIT